MRNQEIDELDALRRALGQPMPPKEIWQEPIDCDPAHLHALARLQPNERAHGGDLSAYARDLKSMVVQEEFLRYALPFCLKAWREDLRGEYSGYGGFVAHFYPALVYGRILDSVLSPDEAAAVSSFMRAVILEEIDEQRGPYPCVRVLTTYGVILPDIERLWTAWWSLDTPGRAVAAVQYISCLVYGEQENPVFGGWAPCLWEFEGYLYDHCWLAPNVAFLRSALNAVSVTEVLRRAVDRLAGSSEQETAARVLADAGERTALLESRCRELPEILEEKQDPSTMREWSQ
jgi:hypothetical protein